MRAAVASSSRRRSVEQVTYENDALTLALGEPLPDQVLDPRVHGITDLPAEAASTQRCGFTGNELAVQPGGAARMNLRLEVRSERTTRAMRWRRALSLKRRSSTIPPGAASPAASKSARRTW